MSDYVIYWGSSNNDKIATSAAIATLAQSGSNLTYTLSGDTPKPTGATHLLVRTKNANGEMATGVSALIVDKGVPTNAAVSIAFNDTDAEGGKLAGNVSISKSSDEIDLTHYALYWGSNATTKISNMSPIAELPKVGSNITYSLPEGTVKPAGATHFLVLTRNTEGEMAMGVTVPILDRGIPVNPAVSLTFADSDIALGKLSGVISIGKALNDSDFSHYVIYWGLNAITKMPNMPPIAELPKSGSNLFHTLPLGTVKPVGATHFLVRTKMNADEMQTGENVVILDKSLDAAASLAFADSDTNIGLLGGSISIGKAANESELTHYMLYWGSYADSVKLAGHSPIAALPKTGANLVYTLPQGTIKPNGADYLIVRTKNVNSNIEMANGIGTYLRDVYPVTAVEI